jgi:hypothetical protein
MKKLLFIILITYLSNSFADDDGISSITAGGNWIWQHWVMGLAAIVLTGDIAYVLFLLKRNKMELMDGIRHIVYALLIFGAPAAAAAVSMHLQNSSPF